MIAHEAYEELAAGYALHALEPEDELVFLQHLAGCARCERALDAHRETAAHLAYGAGPASLPEGLLDRIRASVVAESGQDVFAGPGAEVVPLDVARERRRRRVSRPVAALAAAASLVVVALVGSNLALRQDRVAQLASSDRLAEAVHTLEDGPGRNVPLLDRQRRVAAVAVVQGDHVSLVVEGLAVNEPRTTYVLWEQARFGGLHAIATFDVRDGGVAVVRDLPLRSGSEGPAAFAITQEQGEAAPARPLVAPVASGAVQDA
ncbi:MAG: putative transrane anti-sigma factor [Frankiales bacterium]|nr:putative transrane anti-sigma factor [Frankiales bacterium]